MKTRRNIYFIIGSILILLNLLVDITDLQDLKSHLDGSAENIGYLIGSHFILIIGLLLLRLGFKAHKRIKSLKDRELEESINEIGKPN